VTSLQVLDPVLMPILAIDIANFLRAGHIVATFEAYGRAFIILVTEGLDAGRAAFTAAARGAEVAAEALQDVSKLAKYAAKAAEFLKAVAILGVIADAFILAFAAYEESQQRDELRNAINELFVRRIISKFYEQLCDAIKNEKGLMLSYLVLLGKDGTMPPVMQPAADTIAGLFVTNVHSDWDAVSSESCYQLLATMDKNRGSWTNEDPSHDDAIAKADTGKDSSGTGPATPPIITAPPPVTPGPLPPTKPAVPRPMPSKPLPKKDNCGNPWHKSAEVNVIS